MTNQNFETPRKIFNFAQNYFNLKFDLDVCATKKNSLCKNYNKQLVIFNNTQYQRNRQAEYPSIADVTIALAEKMEGKDQMWDEITAQRLDVKSKYPKP